MSVSLGRYLLSSVKYYSQDHNWESSLGIVAQEKKHMLYCADEAFETTQSIKQSKTKQNSF